MVNIGCWSELLIRYLIMGCFYDSRDLADQHRGKNLALSAPDLAVKYGGPLLTIKLAKLRTVSTDLVMS